MTNNLDIFKKEFLGANSWPQRKDGVPLNLLDNLSSDELKIAETELINALSLRDDWPITGVGYIKSKDALSKLYELLEGIKKSMKVTIAHSIFKICGDNKMIDIVLDETPKITNQYELIAILYFLPDFKDERLIKTLDNLRSNKEYLIAYNATRVLGLSTDEVVQKFRNLEKGKKVAVPNSPLLKAERSWWRKLFDS